MIRSRSQRQGAAWLRQPRIAQGPADVRVRRGSLPWAKAAPPELRQLLDSGDKKDFDRFFEEGLQEATPDERQNWEWRAKPYGLRSPFDVFIAARQYNLTDVVDQITTPLLITDPEGEQFPGPTKAALRQTPRHEAVGSVHSRRRRRPPLRTPGEITARATHVRLARRNPRHPPTRHCAETYANVAALSRDQQQMITEAVATNRAPASRLSATSVESSGRLGQHAQEAKMLEIQGTLISKRAAQATINFRRLLPESPRTEASDRERSDVKAESAQLVPTVVGDHLHAPRGHPDPVDHPPID